MNQNTAALLLMGMLAGTPGAALATPILGTELAGFAVLGGATVTNTGATTLEGDLGVSPGSAITGKTTITVNGTNAAIIGNLSVHEADAIATTAQAQLAAARTSLALLGGGILQPADLVGLTLVPGVYTVPAGVSNLTGALTLDGLGNANAAWVFQVTSTLITSPGAEVNLINTGAGAGVYWNIGSSATLDTGTVLLGNLLALANITLNTDARIACGRALAQVEAVNMDTNTISNECGGSITAGSNGLSGGLDIRAGGGTPVALPFVPTTVGIPEPTTLLLLSVALAGVAMRRKPA